MRLKTSAHAVDLIEEGIDLAVRIGELRDSTSLAARRLGVQHLSIGAAPSYLARHRKGVDLDQLDAHSGIAYSRGGVVTPGRVLDSDGSVRELRFEPQLSLDDVQAIAGAGIAGFGLVQIPCWLLARYVESGELAVVRERCGTRAQEIHAVWPKTRYLPLKTRCAIDALAAEIPPMIPT
jgi:DNA-binding transcriptional LysR family regulator